MIFEWLKSFYTSLVDWLNKTDNVLDLDDDFFNDAKIISEEEIKKYLYHSTPDLTQVNREAKQLRYKEI